MKCVICKHGETSPGTTSMLFEKGETIIVIKSIPAEVCDNCGETYTDAAVTRALLHQVDETAQRGVQVDIRQYAA